MAEKSWCWQRQDIFRYSQSFRSLLRPTQPSFQRAPMALPSELQRPGREADKSPHTVRRLRRDGMRSLCAQGQIYFTFTPSLQV